MNNFLIVETKKGNISLKVRCEDGSTKTIHSLYDPEAEASSIVDAFAFDGKGILVILGLGLGYHVAEFSKKYSVAEILVVEALHEIREIAKEYGPAFGDNVKFIVGLSPAEAIRKITDCQMRNGIKSLSVLALPAIVSAFPAYYQPVFESLKRTMSVRLWDRLRYPKFNKDVLSIILIDSAYFLVKEVEKALKSLGHKVVKVSVRKGADGEDMITRYIETILNTKPDLILTINHLGFDEEGMLTSFFSSIEMPVASWYVDSPRLIVHAFDKNVSPWMSLFLWDKSYMKDMEDMGFESVGYLPLGTDENLFKPMMARKHRKMLDKFVCDVGFVGNSMVGPVNEWMEKVGPELHPIVERTAEHAAHSATLHGDIMKVIPKTEREKIAALSKKEKMDIEAAVLWKATLLYRLLCVEMLKEFNMSIYGDNSWKGLLREQNFRLFPPLNYYKELPFLYNACRINFNATSRQMSEAVNQRVFDVPACGSFLLTDNQEALHELFDVGKEIIIYKNRDEIPDLIRFYLKHPDERQKAAMRGRERVLKEHTYKHRLAHMIESMKKRYK